MMSFDVTSCPSFLCITPDRVGVACNDHTHSTFTIDMYFLQDRGKRFLKSFFLLFSNFSLQLLSLETQSRATRQPLLVWHRFHNYTCLHRPVWTKHCEYGPPTTTQSGMVDTCTTHTHNQNSLSLSLSLSRECEKLFIAYKLQSSNEG